jgi:hypothetical protein
MAAVIPRDDALRIWETKTWTAVRAAELSAGVTVSMIYIAYRLLF